MSDSHEMERWKDQLKEAGWLALTSVTWRDPEGRLWRGPFGAWQELQRRKHGVDICDPYGPSACPDCRGKGTYAGLDITCRRCNGSGMWRPKPEPATTARPPRAADDPDWGSTLRRAATGLGDVSGLTND